MKVGKGTIHLSWELQDPYQEYLDSTTTSLGSSSSSTPRGEGERQGGRDAEYEKALEENRQILRVRRQSSLQSVLFVYRADWEYPLPCTGSR